MSLSHAVIKSKNVNQKFSQTVRKISTKSVIKTTQIKKSKDADVKRTLKLKSNKSKKSTKAGSQKIKQGQFT